MLTDLRKQDKIIMHLLILCFIGSEKIRSMCSASVINPKISFHNISAMEEVS